MALLMNFNSVGTSTLESRVAAGGGHIVSFRKASLADRQDLSQLNYLQG